MYGRNGCRGKSWFNSRVKFFMNIAAGQALVFLKIGVLAFAIMAAIWLLVRYVESRGKKKSKSDGRT